MAAPQGARPSRARGLHRSAAVPGLIAIHQDATGNAHALVLSY